nr:immunoglobulin heavy chain junction region [Mus musculus]
CARYYDNYAMDYW